MKSGKTREELQSLSHNELVDLVMRWQQTNMSPLTGSDALAVQHNGDPVARDYEASASTTAGENEHEACRKALQDQRRRTAFLTQIAIDLNAPLDVDTIVERVLRVTATTLEMSNVGILLVNSSGKIEVAISFKDDTLRTMSSEIARAVLDGGLGGWVLRHDQSVVTSDVSRDKRWIPFTSDQQTGSAIVIPIKQAGNIMGTMTVFHKQPHYFTSYDLLLLEGVVAQMSVALSAAHHRISETRRREQAFALLSTSQYLTAERSLEELAAMLQEKSTSVFDAEYGMLYAIDANGALSPVMIPAALRHKNRQSLLEHAADAARSAWEQEKIVTRVARDNDADLSYIALPLVHSGNAFGAITLVRYMGDHVAFSANTWSLLTVFTSFIASTCANMQLVSQLRGYTETLENLVSERTLQLQHSRDTLRIIFDNIHIGLILLDSEEHLLAANNAFCLEIIRREPRELVGQSYAAVWEMFREYGDRQIDMQDAAPLVPWVSRAQKVKHITIIEGEGQHYRYEMSRMPILDESGIAVQYLELWHAITAHDRPDNDLE